MNFDENKNNNYKYINIEKKLSSTSNSSNDNFFSYDYRNRSNNYIYKYDDKKEISISPFHSRLRPFLKYISTNKDLSESLNESNSRKKNKITNLIEIDSCRNRTMKKKK
jgi:hypothetical protein